MRLAGLLATAALLGSGAVIATMVVPSAGEDAVVPAAPAATPAPDADERAAKPRRPRLSRGARRARRSAVALLAGQGYEPVELADYEAGNTLRVLIGRDDANAQRAFFFAKGEFLGYDSDTASGRLRVARAGERSVTLAYGLYEPGDRRCCPDGGTARVRFRWSAEGLVPQDELPPAAVRQPSG
jgi:hypothetical protein